MKLVVTDWDLGDAEPARRILKPAGIELEIANCETPEQVIAAATGAEALMVHQAPVDRSVFEACEGQLRFVSRLGIGPWHVDLEAATEAHVAVADCPKYCTEEAVTHTLALVLALNRRLAAGRQAAREGHWRSYGDQHTVLAAGDVVLGIVGLGRIGRRLAAVADALGMEPIAYDPHVVNAPERCELESLDTVLADSDILCLLCPDTPETHHLINAETLAKMKPGSYLVNTARGGLVDEAALLAALDAGHLAGAALDVLEDEPPSPDHPLLHREDVFITPHVAYVSEESQHELKVYAARTVVHYFSGERVNSLLTPDFRRV